MKDIIKLHIEEALQAVQNLNDIHKEIIATSAQLIIDCYKSNGAVFVCGNGGSAADAQHISAELVGRFLRERRALPCTALTTNTSILSAIGNDSTYDVVFSRQVEAYVRAGDILWAISTSGKSANVIEAMKKARHQGAKIIGFTGRDGGNMPSLCDVCFIAPSETTYSIQQLHQIAYHIVCDLVERAFSNEQP
jgi:D-sedoheptulose 7-phosphate isomerase